MIGSLDTLFNMVISYILIIVQVKFTALIGIIHRIVQLTQVEVHGCTLLVTGVATEATHKLFSTYDNKIDIS